jgi:hypothetical protein
LDGKTHEMKRAVIAWQTATSLAVQSAIYFRIKTRMVAFLYNMQLKKGVILLKYFFFSSQMEGNLK